MSSYVNYSYVGMTSGINLPNSVIVQGGVDGAFFPANQIGWGKSIFAGAEFGSTEGLLNAIEAAIGTGGEGVVQDLKDYLVSEGYITLTQLNTKLNDYATKGFVSDANAALDAALKKWVEDKKYALASDLKAHTDNSEIHITAAEREKWNTAKDSIDAFLNENAVSDDVVNTLKEIQEYITSDGAAADKMTKDIAANKRAIGDEVKRASEAEAALDVKITEAKNAAKAATTKIEEGTDAGNNLSITSVSDANGTTYTINLSDVASAAALSAEVTRATQAEADALKDAKAYADGKASDAESKAKAAATKIDKGVDAGNNLSITHVTDVNGATTYTIALSDVASASALNTEVEARTTAVRELDGKIAEAKAAAKAATTKIDKGPDEDNHLSISSVSDVNGTTYTITLSDVASKSALSAEVTRATQAEAKALADAKTYADGLAVNYDSAGAAATAEQNAKDYTDAEVQKINNVIIENEEVVAGALTNLNSKTDNIITSYTSADNALAARIKTIEDAPYATESYVSTTVAGKIAEVVAGAPTEFDTLKEIADWIKNDTVGATALSNKVNANKDAIDAIKADYLKSTDKTEIVASYTEADTALGTRIDNVVTSYTQADTALGTRIDNVESAYVAADNAVKAWVTASYTTSVNPSANSITVNGSKFTFSFTNNVMSVTQYIATALNSVSLSTLSATKTNTGGGNKYIGTAYQLTAGIDVTTTSQTLTIKVANPTVNNYKLAVHDGTSYIINDTEYRTTNGDITQDVSNYIMADVANSSVSGTTTWGTKTHSVTTTGEKTFSVWVTEEGQSTLPNKTVKQTAINASVTVTGMAPVMKGTDATAATCTSKVTDLVYGQVNGEISLGTHTFSAGQVPTIAVPTCAGKTLKGYNAEGSFQDTSWAIVATANYTLNGCTTEYAIWCITKDPKAQPLVPKPNAGEGTVLLKLV